MAPRGSKGGGSSGSFGGGASCPGAFLPDIYGHTRIPYFVAYCVFFMLTLIILVATARIKKRYPHARKLLGPVYLLSLRFTLLAYALIIIAAMLQECHTTPSQTYYQWAIAFIIFFRLGNYLLLVLVVFSLNHLLRQHHGHNPGYFKFIYGVILAIMGALTAAFIVVSCYNYWYQYASYEGISTTQPIFYEEARLEVAYWALYLLSVIAASILALSTLISMRSRGTSRGNLFGWTIVLTLSMFLWVLFSLAGSALNLSLYDSYTFDPNVTYTIYVAFSWIENLFQMLSWISLLVIAKSLVLSTSETTYPVRQMYANTPAYPPQVQAEYGGSTLPQQQPPLYPQPISYTFHPGPPPQPQPQPQPQQQYHYQHQPVYNGISAPVSDMNGNGNGNGHVSEVK